MNITLDRAVIEQEPVAWAGVDFSIDCTPPQRKPLSDEEIGAILEDPNIAEKHQGNWLVLPYAYARAIEAAHNIKE